jgi:hypothetical protein
LFCSPLYSSLSFQKQKCDPPILLLHVPFLVSLILFMFKYPWLWFCLQCSITSVIWVLFIFASILCFFVLLQVFVISNGVIPPLHMFLFVSLFVILFMFLFVVTFLPTLWYYKLLPLHVHVCGDIPPLPCGIIRLN